MFTYKHLTTGFVFVLLTTSGCSIVGTWSLTDVDPTAARRDFEYHSLTLQKDGTFYSEANETYGIESTSGTYTFKDGILHFKEHDGETNTYEAKFIDGNRLKLREFWQGQRLTAVMKRKT